MDYPKITIVTPSFNQGAFIEQTILSIVNQGYPNLEYFVCDGGSTDETVEILRKYDHQITWWCSEKDKGQTDAINKGMHRATGEIVGWINSDDVLLPGALWTVAKFYERYPDTDFANGNTIQIDKNGTIINFMHIVMNKYLFRHGSYNISQLGMFWRRSIFDKIGYLDDSFHACMDVEWLIRVYEADLRVRRIINNLGAIRIYEDTKTAIHGDIWECDREAIRRMYHGAYLGNRNTIYYKMLQAYKFFDGCFFRNVYMKMKYVGKGFSEYTENL